MFEHVPIDDSPNFKRLGIAIQLDAPSRGHVGLLYRAEEGGIFLCHLAGHKELEVDLPEESLLQEQPIFFWAPVWLPEKHQDLLADWFPVLRDYSDAFLYSPHYIPGTLSISGQPVPPEPWAGLTCATFVLEIFLNHGFPVVETEKWEPRDADQRWLEFVIYLLKEHWNADDSYVEVVKSHPTALRFRPTEVAAAVAAKEVHPIDFKRAERLGIELESHILGTSPIL